MSEFERIVELAPAWDRRHPDPSKDYGIHGVELRMVLKGPLGATQFVLYTNWQLPAVAQEMLQHHAGRVLDGIGLKVHYLPQPAELGYHWRQPRREDQKPRDACSYLDDQPCYGGGSCLAAYRIFDVLVSEGSDAVWTELWNYYQELAQ